MVSERDNEVVVPTTSKEHVPEAHGTSSTTLICVVVDACPLSYVRRLVHLFAAPLLGRDISRSSKDDCRSRSRHHPFHGYSRFVACKHALSIVLSESGSAR